MTRKTINAGDLVQVSNRMIEHLADDYTSEGRAKREALVALTSTILLEGKAYRGYRYLAPPVVVPDVRLPEGEYKLYDETRVAFYGPVS